MEQEKNYVIDARTPEMIERIEKEKPLLETTVDSIKERAIRLFESTGNLKSAIEQATQEV